ncbi:MAG TPA: HDOD domain-containing protein [Burkholderiaceae bacterium]|nr:HDOD domain-containing protein [Burkholderiaceae bacterium]
MPKPPDSGDTVPASLDAGDGPHAMIARQAIMDADHVVVAYELFNRSQDGTPHTPASDVTLVFNALSHAGSEDLIGKITIFVNCTHNSLGGGHLELVNPEKMVLEIPPLEGAPVEEIKSRTPALAELRQRGFRLAFGHSVLAPAYADWLALADYIKLDLGLLKPELIQPLVDLAKSKTTAQIVAEKVETSEQFYKMLSAGIQLFQGYWFAKPSLVEAKVITPSQAHTIQLINLVRNQASTSEIEEVLKKDAMLAFNLMRLINSAGFGLNREITSFREAVMLLGLKKLFRWAALLLTASRTGSVSASVASTAVVRGRLMELLAAESLPPEDCDNAFVVGVFSLLDVMLGVPMGKALDLLSLPQPVIDALRHRSGMFAPYLELIEACETGDDEAFMRASETLNLTSQQVNWAHLQALAWADNMSE